MKRFLENSVGEFYKLFERHRKYPRSLPLADLKEKTAILLVDKCRLFSCPVRPKDLQSHPFLKRERQN